jgi:hypothetical protein
MNKNRCPPNPKRPRAAEARSFDRVPENPKSSDPSRPLSRKCLNISDDSAFLQRSIVKNKVVMPSCASIQSKTIRNPTKENASDKFRFHSAGTDYNQTSIKTLKPRGLPQLPLESVGSEKARIVQSLSSAQMNYRGAIAQADDGSLVNSNCVNHPLKLSEFFVESTHKFEKRIGICSSCAVKLASYQFHVQELIRLEIEVEEGTKLDAAKMRVERLERAHREKEELLRCNKSSLTRAFEVQRKKLEKLFEVVFAVVEKKRIFFEELLRDKYQVEKSKLQNRYFKIHQSKQTLSQVKAGLTDSEMFMGMGESDEIQESLALFQGIFQESELLCESVEFVAFRPFEDYSIKDIVDKVESALAVDVGPGEGEGDLRLASEIVGEDGEAFFGTDFNPNSSFEAVDQSSEARASPPKGLAEIQIEDQQEPEEGGPTSLATNPFGAYDTFE